MKVVKVTKKYFELEDGRIFEHPEPLDKVPSLEEFQKMYDKWKYILEEENKEEE